MAKGLNKNIEPNEDLDRDIKELEQTIEKAKEPKKVEKDPYEKVILEIPISENETEDWLCIVNGHYYRVQRGKKVLVPKFVKELYDNEQRQVREAFERSQKLQKAASEQLAFN